MSVYIHIKEQKISQDKCQIQKNIEVNLSESRCVYSDKFRFCNQNHQKIHNNIDHYCTSVNRPFLLLKVQNTPVA